MNIDPEGTWDWGKFWKGLAIIVSVTAFIGGTILIATGVGGVLGGVLIAAGVGSLTNGFINEASGGSFTAGWTGGLIAGTLCGLGAGFGGSMILAAANTIGMAGIGLATLGMTVSFIGGAAGNFFGSLTTASMDGSNFDAISVFQDSIVLGILNIFAGYGSGLADAAYKAGSAIAYKILATIIAMGTEAFYDITSFIYQKLNKKYWYMATI